MQKTFSRINDFIELIKEYIDNKIDLGKLIAVEKISGLLSFIIAGAMLFAIFLFVLLFAGFALAYAAAKWTGEVYTGFLISTGFFLLIGLVFWLSKDRFLRRPLLQSMLKYLFEDENENDDHD